MLVSIKLIYNILDNHVHCLGCFLCSNEHGFHGIQIESNDMSWTCPILERKVFHWTIWRIFMKSPWSTAIDKIYG